MSPRNLVRLTAIAALFFSVAIMWDASGAPHADASSLKPALLGLDDPDALGVIQAGAQPYAIPQGYFAAHNSSIPNNAFNVVTLNIAWSDLEPNYANPRVIDPNNYIGNELEYAADNGLQMKLRIRAGAETPNWIKNDNNIGGPAVTLEDHSGAPFTVPRWWKSTFQSEWNTLISTLASRYDNPTGNGGENNLLSDVTVSECMTSSAEPLLRGFQDDANTSGYSQNANTLWNGMTADGATTAQQKLSLDDACFKNSIDTAKLFVSTHSSFAFNPYEEMTTGSTDTTTKNWTLDESETQNVMNYCRSQLNFRCVLENNSIREVFTQPGTQDFSDQSTTGENESAPMDSMYDSVAGLGRPIFFQTAGCQEQATPPSCTIGDLTNTIQNFAIPFRTEVVNGSYTAEPADAVEIPGNYQTLCGLTMYGPHWQYCPANLADLNLAVLTGRPQ